MSIVKATFRKLAGSLLVVFFSSMVVSIYNWRIGRPAPDYIGWIGSMILFGFFGVTTSLPAIFLIAHRTIKHNYRPRMGGFAWIAFSLGYGVTYSFLTEMVMWNPDFWFFQGAFSIAFLIVVLCVVRMDSRGNPKGTANQAL